MTTTRTSTPVHFDGCDIDAEHHHAVSAGAQARSPDDGGGKPVLTEAQRLWVEENRPGFDFWNAYVEKNGIPLEEFRNF